jgi:acylphosphatase
MSNLKRVRVVVRGVVQGVGFRYYAVSLARGYGITGWARNRVDGTVEVEAQGERAVVSAFIKDLGIGPRSAHVEGVDVEDLPIQADERGFRVR